MSTSLARRTAIALFLVLAGCSSGRASGAPSPATPPKMTTSSQPTLTFDRSSSGLSADIVVMVDPDGRPDMSTLRITGNLTSSQRIELTNWIAASSFTPATSEGVPVRGEFRRHIDIRPELRRR